MVKAVINALGDERYRSRKFLFASFTLGFASLVVLGFVVAHLASAVIALTVPPLMPVLWWWATVSAGVLSLYGTTEALNTIARREK